MKINKFPIAALIIPVLLGLGVSSTSFATTNASALRAHLNFKLIENGYLDVAYSNGTATIFGYAHATDIDKAKRVTMRAEGIERVVVNAITFN